MNRKQSNKLATYLAVQAVFAANTEVAGLPGIPGKLEEFGARVGEIEDLAKTQTQPTEGQTAQRDDLFEAMIETTLDVASVVLAVANEQALPVLARAVSVGRTVFERSRRPHRVWLAERVLEAAQSVASQLVNYGVTEAVLQRLRDRIQAARDGITQPRVTIAAKRAASVALVHAYRQADALLRGQIDPLVQMLRSSHRQFYAAYRSARRIVDVRGSRLRDASEHQAGAGPTAMPGGATTPEPSTARVSALANESRAA